MDTGNFFSVIPNLTPQTLEIIRISVIALGLFHFLIGMYIVFQIFRMKDVVEIQSEHLINSICVVYIIVLLSVLFLAIVF